MSSIDSTDHACYAMYQAALICRSIFMIYWPSAVLCWTAPSWYPVASRSHDS